MLIKEKIKISYSSD